MQPWRFAGSSAVIPLAPTRPGGGWHLTGMPHHFERPICRLLRSVQRAVEWQRPDRGRWRDARAFLV